uniref:Uncharacterized protein n=1 Tax=Eptatretus burgeri TaxID=7764 RepID=A0A8C4QNY9_EPTBU
MFEPSASKDVWQATSRHHANDEKWCTLPHYPTWLLQRQREKEEMLEPVLYKRRRTNTVQNATITPDMLDSLNGFSSCSGLHLIYGLNALLRGPGSDWNSSNAALLLHYTASKGYNFSWELGNGTCTIFLNNITALHREGAKTDLFNCSPISRVGSRILGSGGEGEGGREHKNLHCIVLTSLAHKSDNKKKVKLECFLIMGSVDDMN